MSEYNPPNNIEPISIFNTLNFRYASDSVTIDYANKHYLKFPNAQGTENLQAINVNGLAVFNDIIESKVQLQIKDSTASSANTESLILGQLSNNNRIAFVLNPAVSLYNPLVRANENLLVYGDTATSTNALTIAPYSTVTCGLRMTNGTVIFGSGGSANTPTSRIEISSSGMIIKAIAEIQIDNSLNLNNATATNRQITAGYLNLKNINDNTPCFQQYSNLGNVYYDNNVNSGWHIFATNNSAGTQTIPFQFRSSDAVFSTTNPPTCDASSTILTSDSSNKIPSTAWVKSIIPTIPTQNVSTIVINPINSTPVNVTIPTNCIKFDIAIYGSGGLSSPAIYYPPIGGNLGYTVQCGAGGGGGFARIDGIYQPRQETQKVNTLTVTMTLGNGNFTSVVYNGVNLAQVYNGTSTTATLIAGGLGCTTVPILSTNYGPWFYSNGSQGQNGADIGQSPTPINLQGGQNIGGGALVNSQMGVGQSYASYSSPLGTWTATPIGYGGAVITFYI